MSRTVCSALVLSLALLSPDFFTFDCLLPKHTVTGLWGLRVSGSGELGLFRYLMVFLYLSLIFNFGQNCPFVPMISIYAPPLFTFSLPSPHEGVFSPVFHLWSPQWRMSQHTALSLHIFSGWHGCLIILYWTVTGDHTSTLRLPFHSDCFCRQISTPKRVLGIKPRVLNTNLPEKNGFSTWLQLSPF